MDELRLLPRILRIIHVIEDTFLGILLLGLICIAFAQIAGRLFLNIGFTGIDPILYHLVLWTGLLGAAVATREKEHINIDIITRFLPHGGKYITQTCTNLFSSIISLILAWAGYRFVIDEAAMETSIMNLIPAWMLQLVIPLAFTIMAARFLIHSIQNLVQFFGRKNPS